MPKHTEDIRCSPFPRTHNPSSSLQGHEAHILMAAVAQLTERLAALERAMYGSKTVRGWNAAAKVLDLSAPTVVRLFRTDHRFPKPSRVKVRGGGRVSPEWPLSALLNYKNEPRR